MMTPFATTSAYTTKLFKHICQSSLVASLVVMSSASLAQDEVRAYGQRDTSNDAPMWSVYGGFGLSRDLLHFNLESPTPYGNVYMRVGQFISGDHVAGQIGFRKPYSYTDTDQTGYYLGMFAGHVATDRDAGNRYNQLGAGGELSYMWQNKGRMNSAYLSLAIIAPHTQSDSGLKVHATPVFGVGVTVQAPILDFGSKKTK